MVEVNLHALRIRRVPRHLARQTIRRGRSGGHDVRFLRLETTVETNVHAEVLRLREQPTIERLLLGTAADEKSVRNLAADEACGIAMIVERRRHRRAKVEVALDAEAVEKIGHRLAFRGCFDDLQIADETTADVALGFMHFHRATGASESDGGGQTGWSRACNADRRHRKVGGRQSAAVRRTSPRGILSR
jgi:hypothetical protein